MEITFLIFYYYFHENGITFCDILVIITRSFTRDLRTRVMRSSTINEELDRRQNLNLRRRRRNKLIQTNDWAEILSHIINCMSILSFFSWEYFYIITKPPVGFQLLICFVNYYELHCIHSRHRRHVAVNINRKVCNIKCFQLWHVQLWHVFVH